MTPSEFDKLLRESENEHLEFKEAKHNFHFEKLVKYCAALANEGGGKIILGVTDKIPRRVVGTSAFENLERTKSGLIEKLRLRIDAEVLAHRDGRILIFHVPSRPIGLAIPVDGAYLMRGGENLVPMTPDFLQRIFAEAVPDYSAQICPEAALNDIDADSIELFRRLWQRKSPNCDIVSRSNEQLLADAELVIDGKLTYAALILFGKSEALGKYLGQAEIVFEYRANETPGPASFRSEFRQGFLPILDEVWRLIDLRNDLQHFHQGLFVLDVPTFDERAIREVLLNAVSHRDYRLSGSIFIRQFQRRIEIVSPGGLPPGITPENILWQQNPRNRRLAEVLSKCGLIERAGQGYDMIFRECIRQSKPLPDFTRTDDHSVWITLLGEIQDPEFLRFLEAIGQERMASFGIDDLMVVDLIHRDQTIPAHLKSRIEPLLEMGVIERLGRGLGTRLLLSRRFYRHLGKAGVYTRKHGLDRETNKALLCRHIEDNKKIGSKMNELKQVLPALDRSQIQVLLRDLANAGQIHVHGLTKGARWYPGAECSNCKKLQ